MLPAGSDCIKHLNQPELAVLVGQGQWEDEIFTILDIPAFSIPQLGRGRLLVNLQAYQTGIEAAANNHRDTP
jgi:hypothetical protein